MAFSLIVYATALLQRQAQFGRNAALDSATR